MAAYVILDIDVTNPDRYAEYVRLAPPTIGRFGGRYLVRAGETRVWEGSFTPHRVVVLEFDSMEAAQAWWDSEDYAPLKAMRRSASVANAVLVKGL